MRLPNSKWKERDDWTAYCKSEGTNPESHVDRLGVRQDGGSTNAKCRNEKPATVISRGFAVMLLDTPWIVMPHRRPPLSCASIA